MPDEKRVDWVRKLCELYVVNTTYRIPLTPLQILQNNRERLDYHISNTFGNIGGALSPLVVGYAVQWWNSWTIPFFIAAGVCAFGGLMTFLVNPRKRLAQLENVMPAAAAQTLGGLP